MREREIERERVRDRLFSFRLLNHSPGLLLSAASLAVGIPCLIMVRLNISNKSKYGFIPLQADNELQLRLEKMKVERGNASLKSHWVGFSDISTVNCEEVFKKETDKRFFDDGFYNTPTSLSILFTLLYRTNTLYNYFEVFPC